MALPKTPRVETMSVSESRRQYSEILNRVYRDNDRVVIEKNGIPVAAIVPMRDMQDAEVRQEQREAVLQAFRDVQQAFADVPADELERELDKALAQAKEIQRAKRATNEQVDDAL